MCQRNICMNKCLWGEFPFHYCTIIYRVNVPLSANQERFIQKTRYIEKKYPYICFVMTMYQALLMALVSLPLCVLDSCVLKK